MDAASEKKLQRGWANGGEFGIRPLNAGRFLSRGKGRHLSRRIDSDELIFVTGGKLEMFEEETGFSLSAGQWLILRRGRFHGGLKEYPPDLSFYWLHFVDETGLLESLPRHGHAVRPERLAQYCQNYMAEAQEPEPDAAIPALLLELIFRELARSADVERRGEPTALAAAAHKFLLLNFAAGITPAEVAAKLKCNAAYLTRLYKITYKTTIAQEINRLRLEYAARLLMENVKSIKEIQQLSGFRDPAYFRRQFRRKYAVSPGQYRKNLTLGHLNSI